MLERNVEVVGHSQSLAINEDLLGDQSFPPRVRQRVIARTVIKGNMFEGQTNRVIARSGV
jgi:hypothetical protein